MGLPNEIVSDNDHLISSSFLKTLCELVGIEQHFSIIYRPKGNGRAEAAVKAVVSMLRICLADSNKTWLTILPWVLFQINNLPGLISSYSPFKIIFGRDPTYIGDIPSLELSHVSVDCEEWFTSLDTLRKEVQLKVVQVHDKESARYRRQFGVQEYQIGDKVWIRNSKERTRCAKLDTLWYGPCEIKARIGNTGRYTVSMFYGDDDIHIEDIKPYFPSIDGTAIPYLYFMPKATMPTTDTHVVDKILDHRIRHGKHEWKVRWKGYNSESDTWEPATNFIGFIQQDWIRWNKQHNIPFSVSDIS